MLGYVFIDKSILLAVSKISPSREITPLEQLKQSLSSDLEQVDALIRYLAKNKLQLIGDISLHTFQSGGKRLRPLLTLASAKLFDYQGTGHISLATAVEFIHTATLLHDDVVDHSDIRRGTPTANIVWGNKEAILVGDFLFAKAFELMGDAKSLEIFQALSKASVVISEGEVLQLSCTGKFDEAKNHYFEVVRAKTAELFAAACFVGGVLGNASEKECQALHDYGLSLGIAFQIVDDMLDYSAETASFGKCTGDDFKEQKVTLPVIFAYEAANAEEKSFWERTIIEGKQSESDFAQACHYIARHNALEAANDVALKHIGLAENALALLPQSLLSQHLKDLLYFVVNRSY